MSQDQSLVLGLSPALDTALNAVLDTVRAHYVHPETAAAMAARVRARRADGAYAGLSGAEFCAAVTADLRSVYDDRHLTVTWHDEPLGEPDPGAEAAAVERWRERFRLEAEGVTRVERLPGNVGLIALAGFGDPAGAGAAYEAAMRLLADTYALIVDLRANRGGWPQSAVQFCAHLVGPEPVQVAVVHKGAERRQCWTPAYVPGPRYLDRPVHVLTSSRTFSGGEDLAYTLQSLGRATVVGEATSGAAHAFSLYRIDGHIEVGVPDERPVNAVTGSNWEGVGVVPDVEVPAGAAFDVAYERSLEHVAGRVAGREDENSRRIASEAVERLVA
ncbi:S41 family peptidase [Phytomonospora sp. NPDC050363]|uniref:S41 family peptidase n=1 Tax=Phytomonospora sp. NPDC050363 TaxID=3155642 RepID=UPI0033DAB5D6